MREKSIDERKSESLARQSRLAPKTVTTPPHQQMTRQQAQDIATGQRLASGGDDLANLERYHRIRKAQESMTTDGPLAQNALTREEEIRINSKSGISPKASADIARALERLQRACRHQYSEITGRCVICDRAK